MVVVYFSFFLALQFTMAELYDECIFSIKNKMTSNDNEKSFALKKKPEAFHLEWFFFTLNDFNELFSTSASWEQEK